MPRDKVRRQDAELAAKAKAAVGGPAQLARMFQASKQAASEWGRTRGIPRHLRSQLEELVRQRSSAQIAEPTGELRNEDPLERLESLLSGTPLRLALRLTADQRVGVSRAWGRMSAKQRDKIRNSVSRAAVVAIAVEQLLGRDRARKVIALLNSEVSSAVRREFISG